MNMYGTHAAATTTALTDTVADHLGHSPHVLRLYQAAATSDAFNADGSDGHFEWCIRQLTAPGTTAALAL